MKVGVIKELYKISVKKRHALEVLNPANPANPANPVVAFVCLVYVHPKIFAQNSAVSQLMV